MTAAAVAAAAAAAATEAVAAWSTIAMLHGCPFSSVVSGQVLAFQCVFQTVGIATPNRSFMHETRSPCL